MSGAYSGGKPLRGKHWPLPLPAAAAENSHCREHWRENARPPGVEAVMGKGRSAAATQRDPHRAPAAATTASLATTHRRSTHAARCRGRCHGTAMAAWGSARDHQQGEVPDRRQTTAPSVQRWWDSTAKRATTCVQRWWDGAAN